MTRIIGLDTETIIKNGAHRFYSFQLFSEDFPKCVVFSTNKADFKKWLVKRTDRAKFVCFNLSFDGIVLSQILDPQEYAISAFYAKNRLISLTIRKGTFKWRVVDLANIFPNTNLSMIGDSIKIPKMIKPEYLGIREPETLEELFYFRTYALKDAEICYKMAKLIQEEFNTFKSTCASLAVRVFHRDYCQTNKEHSYHLRRFGRFPDIVNDKFREAYHGGRTECFIRGTPQIKLRDYDVNSLYPYVMQTKPYPLASLRPKHLNDVDLSYEGLTHAAVSVDCDFPPIATKLTTADGIPKLCFVNGSYSGWFTNVELRELENSNSGRILKVYESYQWKDTFNPFEKFIADFYEKKKQASLTESPKRMLYKIMLNSLYGKFGEHGQSRFFTLENGEMLNETVKEGRKAWYHSVPIAAYITAYARLHLWHIIKSLNPKDVYYCDTDAVWTSADLSNKVSANLGDLKLEHEASEGGSTFIRSKFYMYGQTVVMKGFTVKDKAVDIQLAIFQNNFKRYEHRIAKALEAQRLKKEPLADYFIVKNFNIEADGKRLFNRKLNNRTLLTDQAESVPLVVRM